VGSLPTPQQLGEEASEFRTLWQEYEFRKMDVQENSEWFLISCEWLGKWKQYVSYDTDDTSSDSKMETGHPGMIFNDDIIEQVDHVLNDPKSPHLNVNLKLNLREEDHYHIIDDKLWYFLNARYGGIEIKRFGVKREDSSDECIIEVNLLKIPIHYFPSQQEEGETHVYTVYESRHKTLEDFRKRIAELREKQPDKIRLWKAPIPSDFEQFYRNNLCEFRKHREIRLDAELLKKRDRKLSDIQFTMDDFIIAECKCQGGFIFEELEKIEDDENINDVMGLEEAKDGQEDFSNLKFLTYDLGSMIKSESNGGLSGLSNLGNTCFMNSALQCMSNTIELSKYFLFGIYKKEINYKNPLGTKGRLATGYAKLMKELWVSNDTRVAPWDVKKAIGTVAYQFQGFAQQDSFELFNYVADTLHEDLNRVVEKPYTEFKDSDGRPDAEVSEDHWRAFFDRNQSVIVDLMYGQLKSRLICQVCKTVSNTFDPFLALSLPIPKNKY
jgi:ubiquitin carboxyl-terminal hydrolase 4/11/15